MEILFLQEVVSILAKKLSAEQVNKKNSATIKALINLMKDLDQKYSIKVGIIGSKAYEKHPDSDLTNAHLGAIHEYGATIQVTEKMRAYLHHIGIHLKKDTNTVVIPTRSFLRMPLLNGDFENYLFHIIKENGLPLVEEDAIGKDAESKNLVREFNLDNAKELLSKNSNLIGSIANLVAAEALAQVQRAFISGGFGKWAPISEITKKNRIYDKTSPPLQDSGDLMDSITAEIKKVK